MSLKIIYFSLKLGEFLHRGTLKKTTPAVCPKDTRLSPCDLIEVAKIYLLRAAKRGKPLLSSEYPSMQPSMAGACDQLSLDIRRTLAEFDAIIRESQESLGVKAANTEEEKASWWEK
jgi:hypothetical protein